MTPCLRWFINLSLAYEPSPFFFRVLWLFFVFLFWNFLLCSASCNSELPKSWQKIALLKAAIEKLSQSEAGKKAKKSRNVWILWLDPVALVTNDEFRLQSVVDGPAGSGTLLVGQDAQVVTFFLWCSSFLMILQPPYLLNVGVLVAKVSDQSLALLESVWRCGVMRVRLLVFFSFLFFCREFWVDDANSELCFANRDGPLQTRKSIKESFFLIRFHVFFRFYWDQNALTHLTEVSYFCFLLSLMMVVV